jgi:hypothetical protein
MAFCFETGCVRFRGVIGILFLAVGLGVHGIHSQRIPFLVGFSLVVPPVGGLFWGAIVWHEIEKRSQAALRIKSIEDRLMLLERGTSLDGNRLSMPSELGERHEVS